MCDPTVMLIAAGASAVNSVIGGVSANKAAKGRARVSERNASVSDRNAIVSANAGAINVSRVGRRGQVSMANIRTSLSKSGVEVNTGTPLQAQVADATVNAVLQMEEGFRTDQEVQGHRLRADNFRAEADAYRAQGKNAMIAGFANAAATVAFAGFAGHQAGMFASTPVSALTPTALTPAFSTASAIPSGAGSTLLNTSVPSLSAGPAVIY